MGQGDAARAADSAGKRKLPVGSAQLDGFHPWGGEPSFSSLGQWCECVREREGYLSICRRQMENAKSYFSPPGPARTAQINTNNKSSCIKLSRWRKLWR